jgi:hypothetical protein
MSLYHERQRERHCVIHAVNNALQRKVITHEQLQEEVQRMADEHQERYRSVRKPFNRREYIKSFLAARDGNYNASVAWRVLRAQYNCVATIVKDFSDPEGHYFVSGTRQNKSGTYEHAIAVTNGYVIDSERAHPIPLPASDFFKTFDVYRIEQLRCYTSPSRMPKPTSKFVDLT